jgi:hypothetical protein
MKERERVQAVPKAAKGGAQCSNAIVFLRHRPGHFLKSHDWMNESDFISRNNSPARNAAGLILFIRFAFIKKRA